MPFQNGSLRLFRLLGVTVYVHWTWALVAVLQIWWRSRPADPGVPQYPVLFHAVLYLSLFLIVLLHEYGHALACKSVGGKAERIVLWPLGGLAFVQPPQRPGAVLWAIAAGPLVNVLLIPFTLVPAILLGVLSFHAGGFGGGAFAWGPNFLMLLALMNLFILAFNLLPFYPLDGGQILRALLWFVCGQGLSLAIAAAVGLAGAIALAGVAFYFGMPMLALIVGFMGLQCLGAFRAGLGMMRLDRSPRRPEVRCPACGTHPPVGEFWNCPCGMRLDPFATGGTCPRCHRAFEVTACANCGQLNPIALWYPPAFETQPPEVASPSASPPFRPIPPTPFPPAPGTPSSP
jgi:Zn-dependent protease